MHAGNYEEKKMKEIGPIVEKYYNTHIGNTTAEPTLAEFYRAVCETVEYILTNPFNFELLINFSS